MSISKRKHWKRPIKISWGRIPLVLALVLVVGIGISATGLVVYSGFIPGFLTENQSVTPQPQWEAADAGGGRRSSPNYTLQDTITILASGGRPGPGKSGDVAAGDLKGAHVYPNPFMPSKGHSRVIFKGLTRHTKLRIFDLAGHLVFQGEKDTPDGIFEWNGLNGAGEKVASGMYFYIIKDDQGKAKRGNISIVR